MLRTFIVDTVSELRDKGALGTAETDEACSRRVNTDKDASSFVGV